MTRLPSVLARLARIFALAPLLALPVVTGHALAADMAATRIAEGANTGAPLVVVLSPERNTGTLTVPVGKPRTVRADAAFNEIIVGDPDIVQVTPLTDRTFYVVGLKPGSTGLALYNEARDLVGMLDVDVGADATVLNRAIGDTGVTARSRNGKLVLEGEARDPASAAKARALAEKFDADVVDATRVKPSTQVNLEVRFIEASRRRDKEVGSSWFVNKDPVGQRRFSSAGGGLLGNRSYDGLAQPLYGEGASRQIPIGDEAPTGRTDFSIFNSLISGALPFGQIIGRVLDKGIKVDLLIQGLEQHGIARRLAEPNLSALSGDTASFLAGGEFPVPVAADDGKVSVDFKKFGVGLDFSPTVLEDGIINLQLASEVSQVDPTTSVKFNDVEIPGLIVRRAKTTVELRDGQSFVIGGLIQNTGSYDVRKFPWLGDLPIIGPLFRSTSFRKQETDLVMIVTPRLVQPVAPGTPLATPLDGSAPPNDVDLFLDGQTEISRAQLRRVANDGKGALRTGHVIDF